jgi:hypothetical protein
MATRRTWAVAVVGAGAQHSITEVIGLAPARRHVRGLCLRRHPNIPETPVLRKDGGKVRVSASRSRVSQRVNDVTGCPHKGGHGRCTQNGGDFDPDGWQRMISSGEARWAATRKPPHLPLFPLTSKRLPLLRDPNPRGLIRQHYERVDPGGDPRMGGFP